jgi:acyl-CoA thioester hydrolase
MSAGFAHPVRVYWEDTDAGGVVFHANYLKFFERARTEWLRAAGFGQQQLRERFGLMFVVAEAALRFVAPARLDDLLHISVEAAPARGARLELTQAATRGATRLADGRITIACVDVATLVPRRVPQPLLKALFPA